MAICQLIKDVAAIPKQMKRLETSDFSLKGNYDALIGLRMIEPGMTILYDLETGKNEPVKHYIYTRKGRMISDLLDKIGYA